MLLWPSGLVPEGFLFLSGGLMHKKGFTLIELLIVMAVIALLIALLMVAYPRIDANLKNTACKANLKGIHQVLVQYAEHNRGWFPDCEAYYGLGFTRTPQDDTTPIWTTLSNVRDLKQYGADAKMFFCPLRSSNASRWEKADYTWDTPSGRLCSWTGSSSSRWVYVGYVLIFYRGWPYGASLADGRRPALRNTCDDGDPLVADNLHYRASGSIMGGWYHGGGTGPYPPVGEGVFNSSCNTLFAGGYVVEMSWPELEEQGPGMTHGSSRDYWWFALGRSIKD